MENNSQLIQQARQKLDLGLYVENLRNLANLFRQMALSTEWASACFVLSEVADSMATRWEGMPIEVSEARAIEERLRPLFLEALSLMEATDNQMLPKVLDRIVVALLKLQ
jgi:hypothetical protein